MISKIPDHTHSQILIGSGYPIVVGVDEVGRGCWAGPVTAAAVIVADATTIPGVADSKLLSYKRRIILARQIKQLATGIGIGWVSPGEIDKYGLSWAVRTSGLRALSHLGQQFDAVILDGNHNYLKDDYFAQNHIKADSCCLNVASASIIAKVARDQYMQQLDKLYPGYGFASHKGYGTPYHRQALKLGITPIHRRSFAPIKNELVNVDT